MYRKELEEREWKRLGRRGREEEGKEGRQR